MAEVDINDLASYGVIKDTPAYQLEPEALTLAENVRFVNGGVERLDGWKNVFPGAPDTPHLAMGIIGPSQVFWPWVSLTDAYVWDGTAHHLITRESGPYNATETSEWNSTMLSSIPIFNNGVDVPQYWANYNIATRLDDLPNWPDGVRAKVIRAFGPFLVALNITKGTTLYPHMVKWSHPADPGAVPISWDETDPTTDAGEVELADSGAGALVDGVQLGSRLFLYKEESTHWMQKIQNRYIFEFKKFSETSGILGPRCVCATGDGLRHVVATQDDLVVNDGNGIDSLLDKKQKRWLASAIDPSFYRRSFVFANPLKDEVWFCFPENGRTVPNRALIWNYREGRTGVFSEAVDIPFQNAVAGQIEASASISWDQSTNAWDSNSEPWVQTQRRRVIALDPTAQKFLQLDSGPTRDTMGFPAIVRREALAIAGRKRNGQWIVDHRRFKESLTVWPKIQGGPVRIRVGFQLKVNGPITWTPYQVFDPAVQDHLGFVGSGRAISIEFMTLDSFHWRLDGYKFEFELGGEF